MLSFNEFVIIISCRSGTLTRSTCSLRYLNFDFFVQSTCSYVHKFVCSPFVKYKWTNDFLINRQRVRDSSWSTLSGWYIKWQPVRFERSIGVDTAHVEWGLNAHMDRRNAKFYRIKLKWYGWASLRLERYDSKRLKENVNFAAFSGSSSPLNMSASDRHKPTVEEALNSLTSEMVSNILLHIWNKLTINILTEQWQCQTFRSTFTGFGRLNGIAAHESDSKFELHFFTSSWEITWEIIHSLSFMLTANHELFSFSFMV